MNTTVNGKLVSPAHAHRLWADFLRVTDWFKNQRGVADITTRARLSDLSTTLGEQAKQLYLERSPVAGSVMNRFVRLEEELGRLSVESVLPESFYVRKAPWAPSEDRLDGDSWELECSAEAAEAEAVRLRFKLHAVRKGVANRIELSKAKLVAWFSWRDAWAEAKAQMRSIGAEIRTEEAWARAARHELMLRQREVDTADQLGAQIEPGWELPSEEDEAKRRCAERGERW